MSWIDQGRQEHGWFGHGTAAHDEADASTKQADPLFRPDNAARRVDYAAFSLVAHAPRHERSRWNVVEEKGFRDDLKTAVGAWYAASSFRAATFRARFFDPHASHEVVDRLRAAASGIVDADSHAELGTASKDLAVAALAVGPDRWPRFVGAAAREAEAAVSSGEVPGARLVRAAVPGTVFAAASGAGAAGVAGPGAVLAPLGRVLVPLLEAAPPVAAVVGIVTLVAWVRKYGTVTNVAVQGFGPADRGVAPVSAEVNTNAGTVLLYHGLPGQTPDTWNQHTVRLHLGADGVLTDRDGKAVGRLDADKRIVPMQGVDVPGLFHGPAATPPGGQATGETLPPAPGTSTTSEVDRRMIERPEARPVTPALPGTTAAPVPARLPAQPGRETAPALPQINERWGDGSPETVDQGHQDKHIPGTNNYIPGRSVLTANPKALLDAHSGKGRPVGPAHRGQPGFKEQFDTGNQVIGNHVDKVTETSTPTTRGTIIYSGKGAHVVPARPRANGE